MTTSGITLTPSSGLTTTEAGGSATFEAMLNKAPTGNVTVNLTSSDPQEGTVTSPSPASLTFHPSDWYIPQAVTVTGVNDFRADGDVGYTILAVTASDDLGYKGLSAQVAVTNLDNDLLLVTIRDSSIYERGGAAGHGDAG